MKTEKRKLHYIGGFSCFVVLPVEWLKKHNLKKGNTVNIEVHDKFLTIKK